MKRVKAERKKISVLTAAIGLVAAAVLWAVLPGSSVTIYAADGGYTIEGEIGFEGSAKINSNVPVAVTVTNNTDKTFKGRVGALSEDDISGHNSSSSYGVIHNRYSQEVEIAPGGSAVVNLSVPVRFVWGRQEEMPIQLLDGKNIIAEESLPLNVCSDDECWVGLLSRDSHSLSYLKPNYYSGEAGRVAEIDFSGDVSGGVGYTDTSSINVYVVNDYDFAALSDLQLQEIKDNISKGAVMLIGGDSPIGSVDRLGLNELKEAELPSRRGDEDDVYYTYYYMSPYTGYSLGNGYIVRAETDFADINRVNGKGGANGIVAAACQYAHRDESLAEKALLNYASNLPNLTDNKIKLIFVLVYLYILFIPLLYFRLKKKDKKEAAVKIIPAAALTVTLLIYFISLNTVYKKSIASIVSYVDLRNVTENQGIVKTAMFAVSPDKGDVAIKLQGSPRVENTVNYNDIERRDTDSDVKAEAVVTDKGTEVRYRDNTKWKGNYIIMYDSLELKGNIECNAEVDPSTGKITGEIINNTGVYFDELVVAVAADNGIYEMKNYGAVADGEAAELADMEVSLKTGAPQSLIDFTLTEDFYPDYKKNDERYIRELRDNLISGVFDDCDSYVQRSNSASGMQLGISGVKIAVAGLNRGCVYGGNTRVNGKKAVCMGMSAFRNEFALDVSELINSREDTGEITGFIINSYDNAVLEGNELHILNADREVELSFYNPERKAFSIAWNTDGSKSIYNRDYSWVGLGSSSLVYTDYDGFIDDNGYVRIRILSLGRDYVSLPEITYYD